MLVTAWPSTAASGTADTAHRKLWWVLLHKGTYRTEAVLYSLTRLATTDMAVLMALKGGMTHLSAFIQVGPVLLLFLLPLPFQLLRRHKHLHLSAEAVYMQANFSDF